MSIIRDIIDFTEENTLIRINYSPDFVLANPDKCMWSGIALVEGNLLIGEEVDPGDLLHEIGHIVTVPLEFRFLLNGNLYDCFESLLDLSITNFETLAPTDDDAATFWAYMAARELGIDPMIPFLNGFQNPEEKFFSIDFPFGMGTHSSPSCQAYYCGLLENKNSKIMKTWDIGLKH